MLACMRLLVLNLAQIWGNCWGKLASSVRVCTCQKRPLKFSTFASSGQLHLPRCQRSLSLTVDICCGLLVEANTAISGLSLHTGKLANSSVSLG